MAADVDNYVITTQMQNLMVHMSSFLCTLMYTYCRQWTHTWFTEIVLWKVCVCVCVRTCVHICEYVYVCMQLSTYRIYTLSKVYIHGNGAYM